ncbi:MULTISPECIES: peptidylprolyl isomerase [unclassified Sphingomonas]|jgi:peptidyl-prolyl cis-trans isomerase D|uniref:peptidylprolyl isomerase n=1 Tax=unclassified Sphingomonas TaxID=196159 RepID=UPI000833E9E6|nr:MULTISPECIES: peptidylprolyl isomerase [unclassified Sphingomonas]
MLSVFRRLIFSRIGGIVTLVFLVVIALAFAAGDITGLRSGAPAATSVARVGDEDITSTELIQRARLEVEAARQRNPLADMSQFIAAGGLESVLDQLISGQVLRQFATDAGMVVSQKFVDGQIASIPAFQGFDGKFNQQTYEQRLRERGITSEQLRDDIRRETLAGWLINPTIGARQISAAMAAPYASLLLERREALIGFIPSEAVDAGGPPDDKALQAYYGRNRPRYTIPERRTVRYALVTPQSVAGQTTPSEAEIAQAYQRDAARFAASEQRTVRQVVIADQAAANRLAAQVRGGTSLEAAARTAGFEPTLFTEVSKADLGRQTAPAVADAAFAAAQGAVAGPVRSPLGWHVVRVEAVRVVPARTLAQAREALASELRQAKTVAALNAMQSKLDDGISEGSTFDELVTDAKLKAQSTGSVLANGLNPDAPAQPDPALARIIQAGFAANQGDDPEVVQVGEDGTFALVALGAIQEAAPPPLARVRDAVLRDFVAERAFDRARTIAEGVAAKVNAGTALPDAMRQTGLKLPAPTPAKLSRAQLAAQQRNREAQVPPAIELMFAMTEKRAKIARGDNTSGWFVVYLEDIIPGDAKGNAQLIGASRSALGGVIGREYAEQFVKAAEAEAGVKRNLGALNKVRSDLAGQSAPTP